MDLKSSMERYMGGFGGRTIKGEKNLKRKQCIYNQDQDTTFNI